MKIVLGDITEMDTDAIVVPASTDLKPMEGISKAVFARADTEKLIAECRKTGHCRIGRAVATPSCGLPCRWIVHTAGAGWYSGRANEKDTFRDCSHHALQKAYALGCRTIAIPLMFSGSMHIPRAEALLLVRNVIEEFEMFHPKAEVSLVLWKRSIYDLALHIFRRE